ncbi:MAG: hypothetical protein GX569_03575 [Candidatus Riflebacteria bacterium]|nr:hypothetical protein [Candidatus Riflebacteria bacterium]
MKIEAAIRQNTKPVTGAILATGTSLNLPAEGTSLFSKFRSMFNQAPSKHSNPKTNTKAVPTMTDHLNNRLE